MSDARMPGMRVLLTRPQHQAEPLHTAITQAGGQVIALPVIDIQPRSATDIADDLAGRAAADIVVFVSPNAVQHGLAATSNAGSIAAIGAATAAALSEAGIVADIVPAAGFDSESLLREPALQQVRGKSVRIVRGDGGRELLGDTLAARGAEVDYLTVYRRARHAATAAELLAVEQAWRAGGVDYVIVMSNASLTFLLELLPASCRQALPSSVLVTPSARVLKTTQERIHGMRALLSDSPATGDLLAAMLADRQARMDEMKTEEARPDGEDPADDAAAADQPDDAATAATAAGDAAATQQDAAAPDDNGASQVEVTVKRPSRAPLLVALLALLAALASAAGVGFLWSKQPADQSSRYDSQLRTLNNELNAATSQLQRTDQSLQELRGANAQASGGIDALQATLDQRLRSLEAVPGRLSNLESSLSALQGISSGLRDTWLLSEAEYYLQIANAQLQLAGNAELAGIALELADERLASLGNPALTDVRRTLADERRKLAAMRNIDLEGAVLTLGSLADAIQSLPLKNDIKVPVDNTLPLDEQQTGMARAMASLKSAMSDVISVRRSDEPVTPLLPPDAAYFLRTNLALQLQTARLAMLRGEQTVFEESLTDASAWIAEYYDTESRTVQSAADTIDELRGMQLAVSKPDISGSLAALRQFMALRGELERAQPESAQ